MANELMFKINEISETLGYIKSVIDYVKEENSYLKVKYEDLSDDNSTRKKEVAELKARLIANEERIKVLEESQKLLELSTKKFDKLDNNIFRVKAFFKKVTFNNFIVQGVVKTVFTALLFGIVILIFSIIIDYISLKFGIDIDTAQKLKDSLK